MAVIYTDDEIAALIGERKPLPADWRARMRLRAKRGHSEADLWVAGGSGGEFRLVFRQNANNVLDFSVILGVRVPQSNRLFRLLRYNGRSHEHTNRIEGDTFYGFHVHRATERYQRIGADEDAYAEPAPRYGDFGGALACMLADAGFVDPQPPLL